MLSEIEAAFHALRRRHLQGDELQQTIAIAVERCALKIAGQPVHLVSPWQRPLDSKLGDHCSVCGVALGRGRLGLSQDTESSPEGSVSP
jgi:hypothetical protein